MAQLKKDLKKNSSESYSKKETLKGFKLILQEVSGGVAVYFVMLKIITLLSGGLVFLGLPLISTHMANRMAAHAVTRYASATKEERKEIRAAASFISAGFNISELTN